MKTSDEKPKTRRVDLYLTVTVDSRWPAEELDDDRAERVLLDWLRLCFPMLAEESLDMAMCIDAFLDGLVVEDYDDSIGLVEMVKGDHDAELLSEHNMTMADFVEDADDQVVMCDHGKPWAEVCEQCDEELYGVYGQHSADHGTAAEEVKHTNNIVNGVPVLRGSKVNP